MDGSTVYIASDYSGDDRSSQYEVTSVLYLDTSISADWITKRNSVRARHLADGRRMAFKSLGDRKRLTAIIPFLDAANSIGGIALSVAVNKSITSLCTNRDLFLRCANELGFDPGWKQANFERMARVTHLISLLVGGLSRPHQNIYWISDQDAIFANQRRSRDTKRMMDSFSSHYVPHQLGEIGLGTTAIDEGDRHDEDLNAIPDLMGGAVAEMTTAVAKKCGGRIPPRLILPCNVEVSAKSDCICSWI